jgi:hypothetical protein
MFGLVSLILFAAIVYFGVKYLQKEGFIFPWEKKELVIKLPVRDGTKPNIPSGK